MLEIKNLSITRSKDGHVLLNDLSVVVNKGEKFAVIGHEGTGKSTLIKAITSPSLIEPYADSSGTIKTNGTLGYLEQDLSLRWAETPIRDFFLKDAPEGPILYERYEWLGRLPKELEALGLDSNLYDSERLMKHLSGGETIKLGIAKLLMEDADILLLDEPTNDLDFETIRFMERFISLTERAVLFISHDETLLENTATGIIHLKRIKKRTEANTNVSKTDYKTYVKRLKDALDHQETVANKERTNYHKKMKRFTQIYQKVAHKQDQAVRNPSEARLLKKKVKHMKSMEHRFEKEKEGFTDIPERETPIEAFFDNLNAVPKDKVIINHTFDCIKAGESTLLENITLNIKGPMKIAITGGNGLGKTTLMEKLYACISGNRTLSVGYMPQDYRHLQAQKTALEFLEVKGDKLKETRARKIMGALAFEREEMDADTLSLSGGQRAKLYLLKMILDEKDVLLLDEPTRNLSPLSAPEIHAMLESFKGAMFVITHDRKFLEKAFDTIYELKHKTLNEL